MPVGSTKQSLKPRLKIKYNQFFRDKGFTPPEKGPSSPRPLRLKSTADLLQFQMQSGSGIFSRGIKAMEDRQVLDHGSFMHSAGKKVEPSSSGENITPMFRPDKEEHSVCGWADQAVCATFLDLE